MTRPEYSIVKFEWIDAENLEPHPEAKLPIDAEDRVAISHSIESAGVYQPLLVAAEPNKNGKRYILDGVNRWSVVMELNHTVDQEIQPLPCMLVECEDPRALALGSLASRRKCSSGQRILAFLEMHRKEVLKVATMVGDGTGNCVGKQRLVAHVSHQEIPRNLKDFTCEAIAARLGVSKQDVGLGVELLQCIEEKRRAEWRRAGLRICSVPLDMEKDEDRDYLEALRVIHTRIFCGSTPIRRWKPAASSMATTVDKGKTETDWGNVMLRARISMCNVFAHWGELSKAERAEVVEDWEKVREAAGRITLA